MAEHSFAIVRNAGHAFLFRYAEHLTAEVLEFLEDGE
jgi:hypothetical protein